MLLEALGMQIACWHHQKNNSIGEITLTQSEYLSFSLRIVDLSFGIFDRAYGELIQRHEALRTTFLRKDNIIWQSINKYRKQFYELELYDLVYCFEEDQLIGEKTTNAMRVIANLQKGPLIKGLLFKIRHDQHLFICILNHIISDAESIRILKEDISSLYRHYKHGHEIPDIPRQSMENILLKQACHTKGLYADKEREYWLQKLAVHFTNINFDEFLRAYSNKLRTNEKIDNELNNLNIGLFFSRLSFHGSQLYFTDLPFRTLTKLRTLSKSFAVSTFSFFLGAFYLLMNFVNGNNKSLFATSVNDRKLPAERCLVGHLMYKIYLSQSIDGSTPVGDFIRKVYINLIRTCKHPIYNESEYDCLNLDFYTDIFLNYLKMSDRRAVPSVKDIHAKASHSCYALSCHIEEYENAVGLYWHYNLDIFTPGSIEFMADQYKSIISAIEDLDITLMDLKTKCITGADINMENP